MLNGPSLVVTAVKIGLDWPASIKVTVTPGMAEPDVSTTRPVRRPATCAASGVSETKLSTSKDHENRIHCLALCITSGFVLQSITACSEIARPSQFTLYCG